MLQDSFTIRMRIYSLKAPSAITRLFIRRYSEMKKIMVAALGLSLLSGTAVFAQNTSTDSGSTMKKKTHKKKKGTSTDSSSTMTSK
jgi:hypothetical protein